MVECYTGSFTPNENLCGLKLNWIELKLKPEKGVKLSYYCQDSIIATFY